MKRFGFVLLLALAGVCLCLQPRSAHAARSYDNCTGFVTSLPTFIASPGIWCLKADLATAVTSGAAIVIGSDDVAIDCNDFKLGGLAAGIGTLTVGINASGRSGLAVRNCNIRGFMYGIYINGVGGRHVIEDNRFDNNTYEAINVKGDGSVIRRNRIFTTGGSTQASDATGIAAFDSVDIINNVVSGVSATAGSNAQANGIYTSLNLSGRIIGNAVRGLKADGIGLPRGLFNIGSTRITLRDNDIVGNGSADSNGIFCASSTGRAFHNTVNGFDIPMFVCHDSGANYTLP